MTPEPRNATGRPKSKYRRRDQSRERSALARFALIRESIPPLGQADCWKKPSTSGTLTKPAAINPSGPRRQKTAPIDAQNPGITAVKIRTSCCIVFRQLRTKRWLSLFCEDSAVFCVAFPAPSWFNVAGDPITKIGEFRRFLLCIQFDSVIITITTNLRRFAAVAFALVLRVAV
jgi:hypothetical protein